MNILSELYATKEQYESELIMAKAKVSVINDVIANIELKVLEAQEEVPEQQEETTQLDESY